MHLVVTPQGDVRCIYGEEIDLRSIGSLEIRRASHGAQVKLIDITGWGQEADKQKAFAAGFDHHLTKPVDTRQLSQLIEP